jgi:hypothetical protein
MISTYSNLMTGSQLKQVTTAFPSSRCRDIFPFLNENPGTKERACSTHMPIWQIKYFSVTNALRYTYPQPGHVIAANSANLL